MVLLAAGTVASVVLLAGCGGDGGAAKLVPGQSDAAAACQAQGVHAAGLATDAAAQNPLYAALAADEGALAATQANQESELSDGDSTDDNGLGSLAGGETAGSSAGVKVVSDCVSLGLPVPH
ncbi:MAG TPA: hypothetical protein VHV79_00260 [Mycobacteriales bacterium]|nr:hypothetical protein [Mycobacteriales bacterium]